MISKRIAIKKIMIIDGGFAEHLRGWQADGRKNNGINYYETELFKMV
jgi:hypothetical protein